MKGNEVGCCWWLITANSTWLHGVVTHWGFDASVLIVVIVNCLALSFDGPLANTGAKSTLELINFVCQCIFSVEMVMKIAGLSIHTYFTDGLNLFDGTLVVIGWTDIFLESLVGNKITLLRVGRALRPLRSTHHFPQLRVAVASLLSAMPDILQVTVHLLILLFLSFLISFLRFG